MSIPTHGPLVVLRCRKCGRKTDHVLIDTTPNGTGQLSETYECQECGEAKRIYEFANPESSVQVRNPRVMEPPKKDSFEVIIRKKKNRFF